MSKPQGIEKNNVFPACVMRVKYKNAYIFNLKEDSILTKNFFLKGALTELLLFRFAFSLRPKAGMIFLLSD